jgi:hypothetical protein
LEPFIAQTSRTTPPDLAPAAKQMQAKESKMDFTTFFYFCNRDFSMGLQRIQNTKIFSHVALSLACDSAFSVPSLLSAGRPEGAGLDPLQVVRRG